MKTLCQQKVVCTVSVICAAIAIIGCQTPRGAPAGSTTAAGIPSTRKTTPPEVAREHHAYGPRKLYSGPKLPSEEVAVLSPTIFDAITGEPGYPKIAMMFVITENEKRTAHFPEGGEDSAIIKDARARKLNVWDTPGNVDGKFIVTAIDGKKLQPPAEPHYEGTAGFYAVGDHVKPKGGAPKPPIELQLEPGEHSVDASISTSANAGGFVGGFQSQLSEFRFVAEIGHTYRLCAKALEDLDHWEIWLEDATTGQTVKQLTGPEHKLP